MHYRIIPALMAFLISLAPAAAQSTKPAMNKTTGAISRLNAYSKIDGYTGSTVRFRDSLHYFYSGDNGWDELAGEWSCDSAHVYGRYYNSILRKGTFRQSIGTNITNTNFTDVDSFNIWRMSYVYQSGKVSELFYEHWNRSIRLWQPSDKILLYYDNNNQLTDSLSLSYSSSGTWDSVAWLKYSYGQYGITSMQMLHHQFGGWITLFTLNNVYTNGRLSETAYDTSFRYNYNYDNNNNLIEAIGERWYQFTWDLWERNTFTYDSKGNLITQVKAERYNDRDTLRTQYEYNSYNQPTHIKYERFYNQLWHPSNDSTDKYYYYEEVFPSSVKKVDKDLSTVDLYPVPATNLLTVDIVQQQASEVIFSIYAIDGKILRQWNQPMTGMQYKETISIADLPAGNYILKASSNKGEISKQFTVAR